MIKFGLIANTHGIRGQVKILTNSDFKKERLKKGSFLYIQDKFKTIEPIKLEIKSWSPNKTFDIIGFVGLDNINDVERYKNFNIYVDDDVDLKLAPNEYLQSDLKGCVVEDMDGRIIGVVQQIANFGAQDCLEIKTNSDEIKYIPFVDAFVKDVDTLQSKIKVELIAGLI